MRLILIDNASGYVWGDSADFAADRTMESAADAARLLDESLGCHGRTYEERGRGYRPALNETAYHVFRADPAFPAIHDGQDQETIESVGRDCEKVAVVVCRGPFTDEPGEPDEDAPAYTAEELREAIASGD